MEKRGAGAGAFRHCSCSRCALFSQTEFVNDRAVTLDVHILQIVEQISSVADHLLQTAAAVIVLLVRFEVFGQVVDAGSEDRDLDLGGSRITFVNGVLLDECLLFVFEHGFFTFQKIFLMRLTPPKVGEDPKDSVRSIQPSQRHTGILYHIATRL